MEENFSMEWSMEENFSMEWNMEWKIFSMEWKKIASMESGKIVFHSIPCPAFNRPSRMYRGKGMQAYRMVTGTGTSLVSNYDQKQYVKTFFLNTNYFYF